MRGPPENGEGRAPRQRPGLTPTITATYGKPILSDRGDGHCLRCSCRCRCHKPPPEPPYVRVPQRPGSWGWSGYLAELSAELGSLAAAYEYVDREGVAA